MDAVDSQPEQCSRKARLLLLVEDAGQAAWLAQRVPSATYDVISCPPSLPMGGWVAELRPDLILLHPTEERTLDTAESVRAQTDRPIVVLSASNDDLVIARVLGLGIDEYLVLPLGDRELGARIARSVNHHPRAVQLEGCQQPARDQPGGSDPHERQQPVDGDNR